MNENQKTHFQDHLKRACETWDLNQERQSLEDLLQQRFNFLVAVFTLTVGGAVGIASGARPDRLWLNGIISFSNPTIKLQFHERFHRRQ